MKNKLTQEDILKKHQTNIKAAPGIFALSGVLGIIYVVRYFLTKNFESFFYLGFPHAMLKLSHEGRLNTPLAYALTAAFFLLFIILLVKSLKSSAFFKPCLALYIFDFAFLFVDTFILFPNSFTPDFLIEVILHTFVVIFLSVGIYSHNKTKEN